MDIKDEIKKLNDYYKENAIFVEKAIITLSSTMIIGLGSILKDVKTIFIDSLFSSILFSIFSLIIIFQINEFYTSQKICDKAIKESNDDNKLNDAYQEFEKLKKREKFRITIFQIGIFLTAAFYSISALNK